MGTNCEVIVFPPGKTGKIVKWKVREGTFVSIGRVLLVYDINSKDGQEEPQKLKATQVGIVRKLLTREGESITPGTALLELEECTHPTVMNAMCAECGADLKTENQNTLNASVPMVHSIPQLKVSREQAQLIGKADEEQLLNHRKLVLLVDLDQTLIHTTNDNIPPNIKDVYHFQLYGPASPWYHTRIRPGTRHFLKEISQLYELHICTFGARNYAHMIAMFLDPDGKYFSHRILSRDECFNSSSKTANLSSLFPCGDNLVCIIDDREDVWNFAPNLIHVKPYHFFRHTGDINAPPGLAKHENDEKEGFDFSNFDDTSAKEADSPKKLVDDSVSELKMKGLEKNVIEDGSDNGNKLNSIACNKNNVDKETPDAIASENEKMAPANSLSDAVDSSLDAKSKDSANCTTDDSLHCQVDKIEEGQEDCHLMDVKECSPKLGNVDYSVDNSANSLTVKTIISIDNKKEELSSHNTRVEKLEYTNDHKSAIKEDPLSKEIMKINSNVEQNDVIVMKSDNVSNTNFNEIEKEVEDCDDYLLYLEEILKTIHHAFYELYDELQGDIPDLKSVIPYVRRKVLSGTRLVFSGLVPTTVPLEKSRAYQVARSLGAVVSSELDLQTTHLVAVRPGTAKVNTARRMKNIAIVTPEWLWSCAERWEHIEEKLFPLGRGQMSSRHPPPHCGSPDHTPGQFVSGVGRFMDSINPLMSFSPEDIARMDREVEDIFNESESEGEQDSVGENEVKTSESVSEHDFVVTQLREDEEVRRAILEYDSSSSSADSLSGEHPRGWRPSETENRKRTVTDSEIDDFDEDMPSTKFRRGEALPSDLELGEDESASNGSDEPPDEIDDGDWNMMGAALEREFLSGDRD